MASPTSQNLNGSGTLRRHQSTGQLAKTGQVAVNGNVATLPNGETMHVPKIAPHLSVSGLTQRRKLNKSTGNMHGYMAEDYMQVRCPLPKMFGDEKYGYSLIDIEDPRYLVECAAMSKKLVRLNYDQQIIDLEWRKTYKALLDAEHRQATLSSNAPVKTKELMKKEVDGAMKYLLELQEQKDMYEVHIKEIYAKCDEIKALLKKERDLEDLRMDMEHQTKAAIHDESPFWRTKFNIISQSTTKTAAGVSFDRDV
mmetsp:Transcript_61068/g.160571  ORF Transcript_61068/g.160571 Transcript_61068/m.160571 type:complete len:254 (-) Transcript_61068:71-832(-)